MSFTVEFADKTTQPGINIFNGAIYDGEGDPQADVKNVKFDGWTKEFMGVSFAKFAFDSVTVEWDEYDGTAWYYGHSHYKRKLVLGTPEGDVTVEAFVSENTEPFCANGVRIDPPAFGVGFDYEKKHYFSGYFRTLDEALSGLQKTLPEGVAVIGFCEE
jgi:hypothetical protein